MNIYRGKEFLPRRTPRTQRKQESKRERKDLK